MPRAAHSLQAEHDGKSSAHIIAFGLTTPLVGNIMISSILQTTEVGFRQVRGPRRVGQLVRVGPGTGTTPVCLPQLGPP